MSDELEELFRQHYAPLVRALAVSSCDVERAADAVQDAYVQAARHWRRVQHYDDPAGWIRRVAVNRLIDQQRGLRRTSRLLSTIGNEQQTTPVGGDSDSGRVAGRVDLERAVARLPERQRLVVCLFYLADLSVEQVAAALEIAPGTVKSQLHDARRNLVDPLEVRDDS